MLILGVVGCSSDKNAGNEVSGTVKFNGAPIPGGSITFVGQKDPQQRATTIINKEGRYIIPTAPEGEVKVGIEASRPSGLEGKQAAMTVPPKYRDPNTSNLTYIVTKGKQKKDFDLAP